MNRACRGRKLPKGRRTGTARAMWIRGALSGRWKSGGLVGLGLSHRNASGLPTRWAWWRGGSYAAERQMRPDGLWGISRNWPAPSVAGDSSGPRWSDGRLCAEAPGHRGGPKGSGHGLALARPDGTRVLPASLAMADSIRRCALRFPVGLVAAEGSASMSADSWTDPHAGKRHVGDW